MSRVQIACTEPAKSDAHTCSMSPCVETLSQGRSTSAKSIAVDIPWPHITKLMQGSETLTTPMQVSA